MICKKGKAYITAAMLDNIASPSSVFKIEYIVDYRGGKVGRLNGASSLSRAASERYDDRPAKIRYCTVYGDRTPMKREKKDRRVIAAVF